MKLWSIRTRFAAFGLALCLLGSPAQAQDARISLGVGGGVALPLSPSDRFVPRFADADVVGDRGATLLTHYRPKTGMLLHLEALIGNLSIRYTFQNYGWKSDRIACRPTEGGNAQASRLPNGEFDDRQITYNCNVGRDRIGAQDNRRSLSVHQISGATQFVAIQPRVIIPYATIGGGLLLTNFQTANQNTAVRPGLSFLVGGGLRIPFDRNFSMFIETRYALHLMARGGDYSLRAGRAVAAEKTVLSAVIDPLHSLQAIVGLRMRVR